MAGNRLKTVDPLKSATTTSVEPHKGKGTQLPELSISERLKTHIRKFNLFTERKKKDEAEAQTSRAEIMKWAKEEFVKRLLQGKPGNFLITNGKQKVQFLVQAKGSSFGENQKKKLMAQFGEEAGELLKPDNEVFLNLDIWKTHQEKLVKALNAVDDKGKRLVEPEVIQALFYRTLKVKETVFEDAVKIAKNKKEVSIITETDGKLSVVASSELSEDKKLSQLLWDDLNLTCSISAK